MKYSICPFLFIIGLFFVLISPHFLTEGMFMDGLWYATLSKNLAAGFSSFWVPRLTETWVAWGQPPLAYLLQSPFFLLDGSLYMAKIYSVLTYICTGCLMFFVWRCICGKTADYWIVLLLWVLVPSVSWGATENLLENTMSVFVMLSVFLYLKSLENQRFVYVVLSGLSLALAFLTKGFTGLYPLAFPMIYWLFMRETKLIRPIVDTFVMFASLALPLAALFLFYPPANQFFQTYMSVQVVNSISQIQTVDSRFTIILLFFKDILLPLAVVGLIVFIAWKQRVLRESWQRRNIKLAMVFFTLALAGVLPMMVSLKQRFFYLITVFPIVALAAGVLLEPLIENLRTNRTFERLVKVLSMVMIVAAVVSNVYFAGKIRRDKDFIEDIPLICSKIPENTIIGADYDIHDKWSMMAYFYFEGKVSIDFKDGYEYYLCDKNSVPSDSTYTVYASGSDLLLFHKP